jgi:hypothetical protein
MGYKGGIISGSDRSLIGTSRYTNSYGVWKLGEVYQEIKDGNWSFQPPTFSNHTTTTTSTFTYPSNIASGDMLVILSANIGENVETASGFTQIALNVSNPRFYVGYKIADGTETGTITVSGNEAGIFALFKKPSPFETYYDTAGTEASGSSGDISVSATTAYQGLLIACIVVANTTSTLDATDGMTEIANIGFSNAGASMLYQISDTATSYTKNLSFTAANNTRGILFNIY